MSSEFPYVVTVNPAEELTCKEWFNLQDIAHKAYSLNTPSLTRRDVDALTSMDDPERYAITHQQPNEMVGVEMNPDQIYTDPKVAIAWLGDTAVGFMYAANNVSGPNSLERQFKLQFMPSRNYFWVREVAVEPQHQQQGIAKALGRSLLQGVDHDNVVSAFVRPVLTPVAFEMASKAGLRIPAGEKPEPVEILGPGTPKVLQSRMLAPVPTVLRNLQ